MISLCRYSRLQQLGNMHLFKYLLERKNLTVQMNKNIVYVLGSKSELTAAKDFQFAINVNHKQSHEQIKSIVDKIYNLSF